MPVFWKSILLTITGCFLFTVSEDVMKASQCFKSRGIPKVAFECPPNEMIKISRAFHGIAVQDRETTESPTCQPSPGHQSTNCTYCPGDCIDDSMNLVYDWSRCMGNTSCIRTVMQSYMPECTENGHNKFSQYLQVEYECIPKSSVIDICSRVERWMQSGYIMSPNYPNHYPTNVDCLCRLETEVQSRIVVSFYDLLLETRQGRCRADWLMLRQKGQKHRHCGAIMTGTKNITSNSQSISLQLHTDQHDNRTQSFQYFTRDLKGFWLAFKAEPSSNIQVSCRKLTKQDKEVEEILLDDADYEEVVSTKDFPTTPSHNTIPKDSMAPGDEGNMAKDMGGSKNMTKMGDDKKMEKEDKTNKENEVDYQEGNGCISTLRASTSLLLVVVNSCFLTFLKP